MDKRNRALLTDRVNRSWEALREQAIGPAAPLLTDAVEGVDWEGLRRRAGTPPATASSADEAMVRAVAEVVIERVRSRLPEIVHEALETVRGELTQTLDERLTRAIERAVRESLSKPG